MDGQYPKEPGSQASSRPEPAKDDGRYVDGALLESVESFLARMKKHGPASTCGPADLHRIEQFLYHEAQLLDGRRYQDWFELLTNDFTYWIPATYGNASLQRDVAVNFDDRRRILDRIAFTESGVQMAQTPPSRTLRSLTNVRAWPHAEGNGADGRSAVDGFDVAAGLVIWAHRRGTRQTFVGHMSMRLQPRGDTFAIKTRVIELLDADEPQGNNSFIL